MNAKRDQNRLPAKIGVSSEGGVTILPWKINPVTGRLILNAASFTTTPPTVARNNAGIDENRVKSMIGVSEDDGITPVPAISVNGNILIKVV